MYSSHSSLLHGAGVVDLSHGTGVLVSLIPTAEFALSLLNRSKTREASLSLSLEQPLSKRRKQKETKRFFFFICFA
ncbi:uncharacterized protein G2W53_004089 [Senna tora]|uniref:Uncharacterized protein n=1 Tax=Senna tora TaxID=362788 RepID=A0A834XBZ9_9FABA|nr:uncharacterized protein G2W53_004089 [Senna tora]